MQYRYGHNQANQSRHQVLSFMFIAARSLDNSLIENAFKRLKSILDAYQLSIIFSIIYSLSITNDFQSKYLIAVCLFIFFIFPLVYIIILQVQEGFSSLTNQNKTLVQLLGPPRSDDVITSSQSQQLNLNHVSVLKRLLDVRNIVKY